MDELVNRLSDTPLTEPEVTDEMISREADRQSTDLAICHPADSYIFKDGFMRCAKWMRSRLQSDTTKKE